MLFKRLTIPFIWLSLLAGDPGLGIAEAARAQMGITVRYDGSYQRISYPGGDVPKDRGVCTDVVIRAYRAFDVDLQVWVHEDMLKAWSAYPKLWGQKSPDRNIDHRRVPNLAAFFTRKGGSLPVTENPKAYLPGDLVTWRLSSGLPHIGVISDERSPSGTPLVIHNIGWGVVQEDQLFKDVITGHYRYLPRTIQHGTTRGTRK